MACPGCGSGRTVGERIGVAAVVVSLIPLREMFRVTVTRASLLVGRQDGTSFVVFESLKTAEAAQWLAIAIDDALGFEGSAMEEGEAQAWARRCRSSTPGFVSRVPRGASALGNLGHTWGNLR